MVKLTKIYTKTGDDGTTSLGNGQRVSKTDTRVEAYAAVDELNSALGLSSMFHNLGEIAKLIKEIQNDLFDVGADICVPMSDEKKDRIRITDRYVEFLEERIDFYNGVLTPLNSFVLPSGSPISGVLHNARAVCRRAERLVWSAMQEYGDDVNIIVARYLNRLSDLLFVLARVTNNGDDVLWIPNMRQE